MTIQQKCNQKIVMNVHEDSSYGKKENPSRISKKQLATLFSSCGEESWHGPCKDSSAGLLSPVCPAPSLQSLWAAHPALTVSLAPSGGTLLWGPGILGAICQESVSIYQLSLGAEQLPVSIFCLAPRGTGAKQTHEPVQPCLTLNFSGSRTREQDKKLRLFS